MDPATLAILLHDITVAANWAMFGALVMLVLVLRAL